MHADSNGHDESVDCSCTRDDAGWRHVHFKQFRLTVVHAVWPLAVARDDTAVGGDRPGLPRLRGREHPGPMRRLLHAQHQPRVGSLEVVAVEEQQVGVHGRVAQPTARH